MDAMSMDQALPKTTVQDDPGAETPFYIAAMDSSTRPRRTLKYGDTFTVLDSYGDIGVSPASPTGSSTTIPASCRSSSCW